MRGEHIFKYLTIRTLAPTLCSLPLLARLSSHGMARPRSILDRCYVNRSYGYTIETSKALESMSIITRLLESEGMVDL